MILGISSFTYGWNVGVAGQMPSRAFNEVDLVNLTHAFGLKCLQIGDNLPIHLLDESRKIRLKQLLTQHGLRFEIGARGLYPKHLESYLILSKFLGASLLRFIIDGEEYEPKTEEVVAILKDFLPEFKQQNLTLGIENHDRQSARELALIMDKVADENVGICLDCVNSMGAGEGLEQVASILAPYTVNLHIKDFKTSRLGHKMGFMIEGQIAGKGMTNVPMLLEKLAQYGRCQSAILEQWVPPTDDIESTCQKEQQWAEEGVKYLKNLNTSFKNTQK